MTTDTAPRTVLSDRVKAWLRTIVPAAWAFLVAWAVDQIPALAQAAPFLDGLGNLWLVPAVLAAWKYVWDRVDMPRWLAALLLGHPDAPTYPKG